MAAILGITDRRLQQLVVEGMPRQGYGLYPLAACVQWYLGYWQKRATGRVDKANDPRRVKREDIETAMLEAKYQEQTGHLISRVAVVQVVSAGFLRLGKAMDGLATALGRELNWSSDTVRIVRARHDEMRRNFVRDSREYIDVVEDPPKAANAKPKKRA